jgi:UDP-glucose 4-epimerase
VLVTGATGFVGGALLRRLCELDVEVVALGRSAPRDAGRVTFLACDLARPETVLRHRDALGDVDAVVHLGGAILRSSDPAADEMAHTLRVNVEGTAHLVAALPAPPGCFCYTSTLDVYGPPRALPVDEEHPTRPATHYAASKLAAEHVLAVWARRTGTPLAVLRLSQVYGPGDTSAKAIPSFVRACLRGEAPRVHGDGSDTRDWVYVDDVVEALLLAVRRRAAGTYNIAGGHGSSVREVLAAVGRLSGARVAPAWEPASRPATHVVLDVRRAHADLGWAPRVPLEEGLRRTVGWFRDVA